MDSKPSDSGHGVDSSLKVSSSSTNVACGSGDTHAPVSHTERSEQEYFERNTRMGCILFVGNLPFQTPWQHVKDRFQDAGKVRYTDLIADNEGRPKGSALVTMESPEGALRAIEMFNEQLFDGRRLIVRLLEAGRRPPLVQKERMPTYGRGRGVGHVGDLAPRGDYCVPTQHLGYSSYSGGRGSMRGAYGGHHGGNSSRFDEIPKPRSQQWAESEDCARRRLIVGNLPFDCTDAALFDTFRQVGSVIRAEVQIGRNGRSTGNGTVLMATADEACTAIAEFDGIEMAGRPMRVSLDS